MKESDLFQPKPDPTRHFGDFSEGLRNAILGDFNTAKIYFTMASDRASRDKHPGYEKYYQALIAWIDGDIKRAEEYSNDLDVMYIGKKRILNRLIKAKIKDPGVSFANAYRYGRFYDQ